MEYIKAIDKLGRIALPISFRRKIMLSENDNVIISVEEDTIIIRGAQVKCKLCGKNQAQEENKKICESCIAEIINM
ncbi:MAG: AbrB/MazE/SpoVT family DNA-binding domain-containing protein [Clostridia bacterium]|nr:AbrB/MazE/SpoVT family DNA-binding domain-containing protein [Clostridia bacterium]